MFECGIGDHGLGNAADVVEIYRRTHERSCDKKRFRGTDTVLAQHETAVAQSRISYEPVGVHGSVRRTRIMSVAQEIVHSVDVEVAVYDTSNKMAVFPALDHCADIVGIDIQIAEGFIEVTGVYVFADLLMTVMKVFLHELLGGM